jgi:glycosyltransferase A (GT-A) superfamily protein (DUF2064 family)
MPKSSKRAIVLFAKLPVAGLVKTRLQPDLDPEQCTNLYEAFLIDTLEVIQQTPDVTPFLACNPNRTENYFQKIAEQYALGLLDQVGPDLGFRMEQTFHHLFQQGWQQVIIMGADSPALPAAFLEKAFEVLDGGGPLRNSQESKRGRHAGNDGSDGHRHPDDEYERGHEKVVIGPAYDGGYYLVGAVGGPPPIFRDIPWSTDQVLPTTLQRLESTRTPYALLPYWSDVDTPDDLALLKQYLRIQADRKPPIARHTTRVLKILSSR